MLSALETVGSKWADDEPRPVIDFAQGPVEQLDFLTNESIDLVVAGALGRLVLHRLFISCHIQLRRATGSIGRKCGLGSRVSCAKARRLRSGFVFRFPLFPVPP